MLTGHFFQIAIWALFSASLSLFLEVCFREGMIFSFWLEWWSKLWLKFNKPPVLFQSKRITGKQLKKMGFDSVREYLISEVDWFLFKPLGHCIICMNVWVSIFLYPQTELTLLEGLFYIVLSNFIVRISNDLLQ